MPALLPAPGVLKVIHHYSVGSEAKTGWHTFWKTPSGATQPQLDTFALDVHTAAVTHLMPITSTVFNLLDTTVTDLSSTTGAVSIHSGAQSGGRGNTPPPASVCMLANFQLHRRYRGGKPRAYIPAGAATDMSTPQQWGATYLSLFTTAWVNYSTAVQAALAKFSSGSFQCNVSYVEKTEWVLDVDGKPKRKITYRNPPLVEPILNGSFSAIVGTQKRRLRPS